MLPKNQSVGVQVITKPLPGILRSHESLKLVTYGSRTLANDELRIVRHNEVSLRKPCRITRPSGRVTVVAVIY
jgi:hypothetical protein